MIHQLWFTVTWFHSLVFFLPISMIVLHKWPHLWHHLLALFLGILIGILDLSTDEVQFTALLLLVFGFFWGFERSKGAWKWAVTFALWVPVFQFLNIAVTGAEKKIISEGFGSLAAFIPSFIGVYAGVAIRWTVNRYQRTHEGTTSS